MEKENPFRPAKSQDKLAGFPEAFAIELIETAIANDTQGVVYYPTTQEAYKKWQKEHQATPAVDMALNTDPSLYNSTF